jgi:hypothetical protein
MARIENQAVTRVYESLGYRRSEAVTLQRARR